MSHFKVDRFSAEDFQRCFEEVSLKLKIPVREVEAIVFKEYPTIKKKIDLAAPKPIPKKYRSLQKFLESVGQEKYLGNFIKKYIDLRTLQNKFKVRTDEHISRSSGVPEDIIRKLRKAVEKPRFQFPKRQVFGRPGVIEEKLEKLRKEGISEERYRNTFGPQRKMLQNVILNRNRIAKYILHHLTTDMAFFGLWLIDRHPNDCIPVNNTTGAPLILTWRCESKKRVLVVPSTFNERFKQCAEGKSRFTFVYLDLKCEDSCDKPCQSGHANFLIYDKKLNEIEHFEPHGYQRKYAAPVLELAIEGLFRGITIKGKKKPIKYVPQFDFCPQISFQAKQIAPGIRERGSCFAWTIWYTDFRLSNPDVPRKELVDQAIRWLRVKPGRFDDFILRYSRDIQKYVLEIAKVLAEHIFKFEQFDSTVRPGYVWTGELVVLPSKDIQRLVLSDFDTLGQIVEKTESREKYPKILTFDILLLDGRVITKTTEIDSKGEVVYRAPFLPTHRSIRDLVQEELLKRMTQVMG